MNHATDTEQVRDLLNALEPSCEVKCEQCGKRCSAPARWIGTLTAHGQVVKRILHCDEDKRVAETWINDPFFTGDGIEYHAEPIR